MGRMGVILRVNLFKVVLKPPVLGSGAFLIKKLHKIDISYDFYHYYFHVGHTG